MNAMLQCRPSQVQKGGFRLLELGLKFLISYFLGSVMGSMLVGRLRGGVDIRTMGSGNAGGTNALRTQGILFALGVIIVDVGKGVLATLVVPGLEIPGVPADPAVSRVWLTLACAAAAVMGHVWPIWHRFRGGKGAATLVGTLVVLAPGMLFPVLLVWAWMLVLFGYVGLATMAAGVAAPLYVWFVSTEVGEPLFIYCLLMALYLIYSHRSNISRMLSGTESRNTRLMIFRRDRQKVDDGPT